MARILSVKKSTLYAWVRVRRIPHFRISGKLVRFNLDDVLEWLDGQRVQAQAEEVEP